MSCSLRIKRAESTIPMTVLEINGPLYEKAKKRREYSSFIFIIEILLRYIKLTTIVKFFYILLDVV